MPIGNNTVDNNESYDRAVELEKQLNQMGLIETVEKEKGLMPSDEYLNVIAALHGLRNANGMGESVKENEKMMAKEGAFMNLRKACIAYQDHITMVNGGKHSRGAERLKNISQILHIADEVNSKQFEATHGKKAEEYNFEIENSNVTAISNGKKVGGGISSRIPAVKSDGQAGFFTPMNYSDKGIMSTSIDFVKKQILSGDLEISSETLETALKKGRISFSNSEINSLLSSGKFVPSEDMFNIITHEFGSQNISDLAQSRLQAEWSKNPLRKTTSATINGKNHVNKIGDSMLMDSINMVNLDYDTESMSYPKESLTKLFSGCDFKKDFSKLDDNEKKIITMNMNGFASIDDFFDSSRNYLKSLQPVPKRGGPMVLTRERFDALRQISSLIDQVALVSAKEIQKRAAGMGTEETLELRNIAMSKVADLMGASPLLAKTELAQIADANGKKQSGIFMYKAVGMDLNENKITKEFADKIDKISEGMKVQQMADEFCDSPQLKQQTSMLAMLDYVCGQIDRHPGNVFYQFDPKSGKITGIQGIDNDLAFGRIGTMNNPEGNDALVVEGADKSRLYSGVSKMKGVGGRIDNANMTELGGFKVIDEAQAKRILAITPEHIENSLKGMLKPDEIAAAQVRFGELQKRITSGQMKWIKPDEWGSVSDEDLREIKTYTGAKSKINSVISIYVEKKEKLAKEAKEKEKLAEEAKEKEKLAKEAKEKEKEQPVKDAKEAKKEQPVKDAKEAKKEQPVKNAKEAKKEQPAKAEKETKKEQPAKDAKEKFSFGQIQELESKKRDENRRKGIDLGSQRLAKLAAQNGKRPPLPNRPLPPTPPHKNNGRTM